MPIRTIQSPGVEIREIDNSQNAASLAGTYGLVMGYTDKGEEFNPLQITSLQDLETNYGIPTNEAERYSYYAAREILQQGGRLSFAKLPYNNLKSSNYKFLTLDFEKTSIAPNDADLTPLSAEYEITDSYDVVLTSGGILSRDNYDTIKAGGNWSGVPATADMIIVNETKEQISDNNEGLFITLIDPVNGLKVQRMYPEFSDTHFPSLTGMNQDNNTIMDLITGFSDTSITSDKLGVTLSDTLNNSSLSETLATYFPTIEFVDNGVNISKEYNNYLGMAVCKLYTDENNEGKLNVSIEEIYVGSIYTGKRDLATGQSIYLPDLINSTSKYIKLYSRQDLSGVNQSKLETENDSTIVRVNTIQYPLIGFSSAESEKIIQGGTIVSNMELVFNRLSSLDDVQLDIVVEAGLGTISEFTSDPGSPEGTIFNPESDIENISKVDNWRAVENSLINFCAKTRKDCMTILDVPRTLVLNGKVKHIRKTAPENTFSNTIGKNLRYVTGLNSSYAALYASWFKMVDTHTGVNFWIPPSSKIVGVYVYNDSVGEIWDSPAGLTRGVVNGVNDIAFNPTTNEADQLYIKSINYAVSYPTNGIIVNSQKTTQVKSSAFDRVNIRRLFLKLERFTRETAKYFVQEPNNLFTRRRLVDVLTPTFDRFQTAGGLYDYNIVCDTSNNTPDVVDANELKVAILVKGVKTAEFILVDFIATQTNANFNEVINEVL